MAPPAGSWHDPGVAEGGPGHTDSPIVGAVVDWFEQARRPLPWRSTTPWGVLVSEFMLQQTPVDRVLPVWSAWLDRWPTATHLAAAGQAEVLRAWGRLGYPRRARRLHECAVIIRDRHDGQVPEDPEELRALPGVGEYTAAAVRAFAFGRHAIVLDTNVRRVLARAIAGSAQPSAHLTRAEREAAQQAWPTDDAASAVWSAAVMELGALVCRSRAPDCGTCPVASECAWLAAGRPDAATPARRQARYEGSDRQARGRVLAVLRDAPGPVAAATVRAAWPADAQRERALAGLVDDGLITRLPRGRYALRG